VDLSLISVGEKAPPYFDPAWEIDNARFTIATKKAEIPAPLVTARTPSRLKLVGCVFTPTVGARRAVLSLIHCSRVSVQGDTREIDCDLAEVSTIQVTMAAEIPLKEPIPGGRLRSMAERMMRGALDPSTQRLRGALQTSYTWRTK